MTFVKPNLINMFVFELFKSYVKFYKQSLVLNQISRKYVADKALTCESKLQTKPP